MIILQNNDYFVKIELKGGQISRFKDEHKNIEYIFHGDTNYWDYTTPTLFPVIGKSYDGKYHIDNKVYEMKRHGILRDVNFNCIKNIDNTVVMRFEANEETLKQYPYYFTIDIIYTLIENKLKIEYEITNDGVVDMPFNFGLHPAFSVPLVEGKKFTDYSINFSSPTKLYGNGPMVDQGLVSEIPLTYEAFEKYPTWIYHNVNSATVGISDGVNGVDVSVVGYPIVAIWTNAESEAPFVCIEPWLGIPKRVEKDLDFKERDAKMTLSPNKKLILTYTIEVY